MSASFLEIIQLSEGEFALRKADEKGEPLMRISFSKEAQGYLENHSGEVVRSMINAAIQTVGEIHNATVQTETEVPSAAANRTIH